MWFALGNVMQAGAILAVAAFYWAVFLLSEPFCMFVFPPLRRKSRARQLSAFVRVPSMVNFLLVVPLSFYSLIYDAPIHRATGSTDSLILLGTLASGYFTFDVTHAAYDYSGLAFLLHAVLCDAAFTIGLFSPFMHYYAAVFLMWEASTVFLNVGWFLLNVYDYPSSSLPMKVVNAVFALTFFLCRIVYGNYKSMQLLSDIASLVSVYGWTPALTLYTLIDLGMTALNLYWFAKILRVVLGSAKPSTSTSKTQSGPSS